jgi:hypothetical protein
MDGADGLYATWLLIWSRRGRREELQGPTSATRSCTTHNDQSQTQREQRQGEQKQLSTCSVSWPPVPCGCRRKRRDLYRPVCLPTLRIMPCHAVPTGAATTPSTICSAGIYAARTFSMPLRPSLCSSAAAMVKSSYWLQIRISWACSDRICSSVSTRRGFVSSCIHTRPATTVRQRVPGRDRSFLVASQTDACVPFSHRGAAAVQQQRPGGRHALSTVWSSSFA